MLIFPLKKHWYDKIKSGEKTVEYREEKPYWWARLKNNGIFGCYEYDENNIVWRLLNNTPPPKRYCYFQLGYKPETRLKAHIKKVEIVDGKNTDLNIDKPVYAIYFELVR